ncbi:putative ELM2 domain-containing protein [Helianthus annuus]|uniref:AT-rich interactive domain-containing protein 1 n=1 Tax=Helianthus annuus TaxID=4232 RepID=UPI000B8F6D13|nr:AT-rich interactive domain-containing protein 1 [Helianthus annuus]KAJ0590419.1 putative ELM2 domain-containing protein [Helianthus annuus]KAJ0928344.1 putative ELM2 domain-containing protein [Helianthus annuus]
MDLKLDLEQQFLMDVDIGDENHEMKFVSFKEVVGGGSNICVGGKHELCVGIENEKESIRKRKKECYLPMLDWVKRVASNPCDPVIGSLPESSKWKGYGNERVWKQVLRAKEAMSLKVNVDSNVKQSFWQKKQKMHPDMYDERTKKPNTRCSQRLISIEENLSTLLSRKPQVLDYSDLSSTESDVEEKDSLWACNYKKKRIPLGQAFQAEVPNWTNATQESETRWLGTRVWPLDETENRTSLIEREPIGKGRRGSCGCQLIGSLDCVRFHVAEKRSRLKLELGSAFVKWKFDSMGEDVSLEWTKTEEKKFARIIKSNPWSSGRSFWDVLVTSFKNRTRAVVVSYYFNVYLLRRRAHQNRADPSNVDSDDDELEKVGGEINNKPLCSPKVHLKFTAYF